MIQLIADFRHILPLSLNDDDDNDFSLFLCYVLIFCACIHIIMPPLPYRAEAFGDVFV